jgi:short-subunit dehydrogenase
MSSTAADVPGPGIAIYGGAKAMVNHFISTLQQEIDKTIFLTASPGVVSTPATFNKPATFD